MSLLNKGLSFAPTNAPDYFKTRVDLFKLYRQLHLKMWFSHSDSPASSTGNTPVFKSKSKFCPPNSNPNLTAFKVKTEYDIHKLLSAPSPLETVNLTRDESTALKELSQNPDIVIKPADKGGAIVIWQHTNYIQEAERQLSDGEYYQKLSHNPMTSMQNDFESFLQNAKTQRDINDNTYNFLFQNHPIVPTFYLLPKIHKGPGKNPPGRPIVAANGSLTEAASIFIDHYLKPYVLQLPSFIRDSSDVLTRLHHFSDSSFDFFLTMDVQSLYTCIPHCQGLEAISHFLQNRTSEQPSTAFLLDLTKWILHHNVFLFNNCYFLQLRGTSMGASFAPQYACLFMGWWEEKFIHNIHNNKFISNLTFYGRYIDDILILFKGSVEDLLSFHNYVNTTNPAIKFSIDYSSSSIHFLDLNIYRDEDGSIHTTVFRKDTDVNSLLHSQSFHPTSLKKNIPKGQFLRARRICDTDTDFKTQADIMERRFLDRGYQKQVIDTARAAASDRPRYDLLSVRRRPVADRPNIHFATNYSTKSYQIKKIILNNWGILRSDPDLNPIHSTPAFCFRRAPTLRDKLVHSHFNMKSTNNWLTQPIGSYRCLNCNHCSLITPSKNFINPRTGYSTKIKHFINCNTCHVIYCLLCNCNAFYIGQTKRRLRDRIREHTYAVRIGNLDYPMAKHILSQTVTSDHAFSVYPIEHIPPLSRGGDRITKLLQRETFWISVTQACTFPGLNEGIDFKPFL